jgi:benzoate membrane transport protein
LIAQGYRVPVNVVTVVTGVNSVVHALFGGHPASVARTGVAILGGADAGPLETRYWSSLIANVLTIVLALGATTFASLSKILPQTYIVALGGLAILASFQEALEKSLGPVPLRFGALVAFLTAATPFTLLTIPSAFWAVLAGLAASLLVERNDLLAHWHGAGSVHS